MDSSHQSGKKQSHPVLDSHTSQEEEEEEEEEDWLSPLLWQSSDDDDEKPSATEVIEQDATPSQGPLKKSRVSKQEDPLNNTCVYTEVKSKNDKQRHCCTCKNARCLKMYCLCFASGSYCNGCPCLDCHNNLDNKATRNKAISSVLARNPNAFKRNIATSPHGRNEFQEKDVAEILIPEKHNKGCGCKRSGCTHRMCVCYQTNNQCSKTCRCRNCKNRGERNAILHRQNANKACHCKRSGCTHPLCECFRTNNECSEICKCRDCKNGREKNVILHKQKAANEAIHKAIGMSKWGGGSPAVQNQAISGSKTSTNRPRISDIITPEKCSFMVKKSMDAVKKQSDKRQKHDKGSSLDQPQRDANEFNDSLECVPDADRVDKKHISPPTANRNPSRQEPDDKEQGHGD